MSTKGWYTFGNHFHWVGMQWLWGNGVLGRSVDDMIDFIAQTGAPGNINFDSNAYEKLAAEEPAALAKLKHAISEQQVEVVGATFGQPYALFHHGESAVRQFTYGVRTAQRVLGVRPRSFWEEEFCFFPQLPQILRDTGYSYASLFFQWTWHTPELPKETAPAIRWKGIDGSEVLTLPRTDLNLHQWPEDVEELIQSGKLKEWSIPVVQQWLELLPSPDWMCRSELVVPGVRSLFDTSGISFSAGTLSTVLDALEGVAEERRYSMDDVFHGMSIGKNGNRHHRMSLHAENTMLAAEAFSVLSGDLGRPYAHWSKYPAWEIEEGWRELLAFQHHDNDECEGLNGHIGYFGLQRGMGLGAHVLDRTIAHLANTLVDVGQEVVANPLGWDRPAVVEGILVSLPPLSVTPVAALEGTPVSPTTVRETSDSLVIARGPFEAEIDRHSGLIRRIGTETLPEGFGGLEWVRDSVQEPFAPISIEAAKTSVKVTRAAGNAVVEVVYAFADEIDALDVTCTGDLGSGPDGRYHSSLTMPLALEHNIASLRHDTPYAVSEIEARNTWSRKYPTGAWMTSPQEFETVHDVFTGLQFADLLKEDGSGVLWLHDGAQGFHRTDRGVANVLSMRDPWDEDHFVSELAYRARIIPHGEASDYWRWTQAQEFVRRPLRAAAAPTIKPRIDGLADGQISLFRVERAAGTAVTAAYRDSDFSATGFADHVNQTARQPLLLRLVEFDGKGETVRLRFESTPIRAWRTTALGEHTRPLAIDGSSLEVELGAHEIATVAIEFPPAPGEERTLDGDRSVWATIHHDAPTDTI